VINLNVVVVHKQYPSILQVPSFIYHKVNVLHQTITHFAEEDM